MASIWAIPGDHFGDYRIVQKGRAPTILVQTTGRTLQADNIKMFRLNYLPAQDCFVSEVPGDDPDEYRLPIIWPPGTRARRDGDRMGVSVPNGGMVWSSLTRTTFWVGDIVKGSGASDLSEATAPVPTVDKACRGTTWKDPTHFSVLDPEPEHGEFKRQPAAEAN